MLLEIEWNIVLGYQSRRVAYLEGKCGEALTRQ
jgi:hypothetical protein